jgi:hypothetical protein
VSLASVSIFRPQLFISEGSLTKVHIITSQSWCYRLAQTILKTVLQNIIHYPRRLSRNLEGYPPVMLCFNALDRLHKMLEVRIQPICPRERPKRLANSTKCPPESLFRSVCYLFIEFLVTALLAPACLPGIRIS